MRPKIGLALSGGGVRGFVHIGVLKVLEETGVTVDCIGGTSMGGVIAAAYACGLPLAEIEEKALYLSHLRNLIKLIDLSPQRRGLLQAERVRDLLVDFFLDRCFENLPIALTLPAVDLISAREVVFNSGMVLPAVLATIAVPGLFSPVAIGDWRLVDGGILNNLPVDRVRQLGADIVIGIEAQSDPHEEKPWQDIGDRPRFPLPIPDYLLDFYRAELIMIHQLTEQRLQTNPPDLLVRPSIPAGIEMFLSFPRAQEVIDAGEAAAREALPEILRVIQ